MPSTFVFYSDVFLLFFGWMWKKYPLSISPHSPAVGLLLGCFLLVAQPPLTNGLFFSLLYLFSFLFGSEEGTRRPSVSPSSLILMEQMPRYLEDIATAAIASIQFFPTFPPPGISPIEAD